MKLRPPSLSRFEHPQTRQHIAYREGCAFSGNPRYASIANHAGLETARRDDYESLGYMLVYFTLGKVRDGT